MKKSPALQVEQIPGDQFPDRETAQRAALPLLVDSLHAVLQDLLERGELVNVNGKIDVPKPSRFHSNGTT